jgi:hypothetical protein
LEWDKRENHRHRRGLSLFAEAWPLASRNLQRSPAKRSLENKALRTALPGMAGDCCLINSLWECDTKP